MIFLYVIFCMNHNTNFLKLSSFSFVMTRKFTIHLCTNLTWESMQTNWSTVHRVLHNQPDLSSTCNLEFVRNREACDWESESTSTITADWTILLASPLQDMNEVRYQIIQNVPNATLTVSFCTLSSRKISRLVIFAHILQGAQKELPWKANKEGKMWSFKTAIFLISHNKEDVSFQIYISGCEKEKQYNGKKIISFLIEEIPSVHLHTFRSCCKITVWLIAVVVIKVPIIYCSENRYSKNKSKGIQVKKWNKTFGKRKITSQLAEKPGNTLIIVSCFAVKYNTACLKKNITVVQITHFVHRSTDLEHYIKRRPEKRWCETNKKFH